MSRGRLWRVPVLPAESTDQTIYARALPRSVLVEERYAYEQTISRNPSLTRRETNAASGAVEIVTPYDGHLHFTRDAVADVERQLPQRGDGNAEAVIGHLVLVGHQDTDLATRMSLEGRFGAHRVSVPIRGGGLNGIDNLRSDGFEHRYAVSYTPASRRPALLPIRLDVALADPDNSDGMTATDLRKAVTAADTRRLETAADAIKRFVGFTPFLMLSVTVRLTLPPRPDVQKAPGTVVRRVAVSMPTSISLASSSVELRVGGRDYDVQYSPREQCLEWFDVPMGPVTAVGRDAPRRCRTSEMALRFQQPGEIFAEDKLIIDVDVEVPGELLSGTEARLFDAQGHRVRGSAVSMVTRSMIHMTCEVRLRDTFGKRSVSPYQSFHFDGVVPDALRIADIQATLREQRFRVVQDAELSSGEGKRQMMRHFIMAERTDGPDVLTLYILVEGAGTSPSTARARAATSTPTSSTAATSGCSFGAMLPATRVRR